MKVYTLLIFFAVIVLAEASNTRYIIGFNRREKVSYQSHVQKVTSLISNKGSFNHDSHFYDQVLVGMSAILNDSEVALIKALKNVDFIVPDGPTYALATQTGAPWGLARVSHRQKLDNITVDEYLYDENSGSGVTVYVLDSGINTNHVDFGGRASWGANFVLGSPDKDENGHGTHCAGTVGSNTYGVAKKANLIAVKVLNNRGSGNWSDSIAAFNWVVKNKKGNKNIISFSVGGGVYTPMDQAVNDAYDSGVFVSVAAGNSNTDACNQSPARAEKSFTVGATNITDTKATFSNYGKCVHILAPGVKVLSTTNVNNTSTAEYSGTSMATPHISGLAASLLSQGVSFSELKENLISIGTKNAISGFNSDTPNIIGFNGYRKY